MPDTAAEQPRRPLWIVVLALLLAAGALWLAASLHWFPSGGALGDSTGKTGGELLAQLGPLAALALASVAAALALSGWLRRALGLLVGLAGLWTCWLSISPVHPPRPGLQLLPDAQRQELLRQDSALTAQLATGRGFVLLGGALLLFAAVVLLLRGHRLPKLGARYQAPGAPRPPADPDRALWEALDKGEDPTTGKSAVPEAARETAPETAPKDPGR